MNVDEHSQTVWNEAFSDELRQEQLAEDSAAWRAVTGLLLTIVSVGLSLALFTAWLCSRS